MRILSLMCAALVGVPFALFAGAQEESPSAAATTASVVAGSYNESPMLTERVAAGTLPPVDERLPGNPVVVDVEGEIGTYGGTLRTAVSSRHRAINSMLGGRFIDNLSFTWDKLGTELQPSWVESGALSDDAMHYTIRLREGVKWSDGTPVTTADLMFTYQDVAGNTDLNPRGVSWLKGVEVEVLDDYGVTFHLPQAAPLFQYTFHTAGVGLRHPIGPQHYLGPFHPAYTDVGELEKAAKEAGVDTWDELFDLKAANDNVERPVLSLWVLTEASTEGTMVERNPYFWKVDQEGNQLPYIDRMRTEIVASPDVYVMRGMGGQYDVVFYGIKFSDFPTLKSNERAGGYRLYQWNSAEGKSHIKFNHTFTEDEAMGELLRTIDFKKALALAIDRDEIKELVHLGQGDAVNISPPVGSPIYKEEYANSYAEFDPEQSAALLDGIGVQDTDGDGFREMANGARLQLELNVHTDEPDHVATGELLKAYWEAIGIRTRLNAVIYDRRAELDREGSYHVSMNDLDLIIYPLYFRPGAGPMGPFVNSPSLGAKDWEDYIRTDGETGTKPSPEYQEAWDLYEQIMAETDDDKRKALAFRLFDNYYANIWSLGLVQGLPRIVMINDRLHNVPADVLEAWPLRTPSNAGMAQWYIKE